MVANQRELVAHHRGTTVPLFGRGSERVILREELAAAIAGRGRLVLIGGEAGIGKTTLARDLAAEAKRRGFLVLSGHCYDLTNTPPYGPWLDLFGAFQGDGDPPAPAAFRGGRLREAIADQAVLFADVRDFFAQLTSNQPVLGVLEDLHWTDPASIELLRSLAANLSHLPLLLVATYRADELTRHHPFSRQLPALVRESDALRLDLKRLSPNDLRELVTAQFALADADETRLVRYLVDHADGNPFFVTELLRTLTETSFLRQSDEMWQLAELDHVVLPPLLTQVIDGRIARLGEETREPLAIAAVIGQEIDLDLWCDVAGIEADSVLEIVDRAVAAHLLDAEREGTRVRFVHALTREALYEGMLPPRRRAWHRRIADALMARPEADPDAVAAHLQRAGDPRAAEWLIRAGDRAQRAYALLTAAERFRAAAALLAGIAGQERTRGLLLYRLARLQRFSHPAAGIADLDAAERLAQAAGDEVLAMEVRYSRGLLRIYAGDFGGGIAEAEAGIAALEAMPERALHAAAMAEDWMADALPAWAVTRDREDESTAGPRDTAGIFHRRGGQAWFLAVSGRLAEAVPMAEAFTATIDPERPPGVLLGSAAGHACQSLGVEHAARGRPTEARAAFARARRHYESLDHHAVIAFSLLTEQRDVVIPYYGDDPDARRRIAADAEAALRRAGGALVAGLSPRLAWLACLVLDGAWDEALAVVNDVPSPGACFLRREVTATRAAIARHRGDVAQAWEAIAAAMPKGPDTAPGSKMHQQALFLQRLAADLALDAGDLPLARTWLEAHDRWLAWNDAVLGQAEGRIVWARYHHVAGQHELASTCAAEALTLATAPRQPLTLMAAHRLLGRLAADAGDEEQTTHHLQAALDLADACGTPFERAQTLLALAEWHVKHRRPAPADALLDEVTAIAEPLGARPLLAKAVALRVQSTTLPHDDALPFRLTAREAGVLRLAAAGLTDAAIAERLFISPRTVSQHLRAVYAKLDVSSRAAATRIAVEHGLT